MKQESGPETIERVLSSYQLGPKLRRLRLRKKIALADLGKHTGLSPSMLSQLENGKMIPTLPTLSRIALVFDVGLDHFFSEKRSHKLFAVVRACERMRFPDRSDAATPSYFFECLTFAAHGKGIQAYIAEFPQRSEQQVSEHLHEGMEFVYVMDGTLTIRFQDEDHELNGGDSVLLDPSEPHSYRGGVQAARALVVTVQARI